jgi:hypothetical protein
MDSEVHVEIMDTKEPKTFRFGASVPYRSRATIGDCVLN